FMKYPCDKIFLLSSNDVFESFDDINLIPPTNAATLATVFALQKEIDFNNKDTAGKSKTKKKYSINFDYRPYWLLDCIKGCNLVVASMGDTALHNQDGTNKPAFVKPAIIVDMDLI
ncbi:MAG: hypothetical protein HUJ63_06385, partial [Enterococcus sp.]|nr:hypothetical protein [Enterococcus sp.]